MPTYQYACKDCGGEIERVQSFSDPSLTECPTCGGRLRKVYGSVGVVFKGSGFYRTDSRSGSDAGLPAKHETHGDKGTAKTDAPAAAASGSTGGSASNGSSSGTSSSGATSGSGSSSGSGSPAKTPAAAAT